MRRLLYRNLPERQRKDGSSNSRSRSSISSFLVVQYRRRRRCQVLMRLSLFLIVEKQGGQLMLPPRNHQ